MIIKNWYPFNESLMLCLTCDKNKRSMMNTTTLGRAGLIVLLAGQLLPMIDFSIVNVALDAMSASLRASAIELALIVAIYGIAFAVCLAMGSRLGDNFGRRKIFITGVWLFAVASLLCGVATDVKTLLLARALQGAGAALVVPQILATLHVTLHGRAHARAIGLYGGIGGLAFIIGQVMGGFLIGANVAGYGWRSVFLINLPVCLAILLTARRFIPETRNPEPLPLDIAGTLLLAGATGSLMVALALGPVLHWTWPCLLLLALFPLLLLQLWRTEVALEKRGGAPLLPPLLLRLPSMRFGISLAVLFFSCWSGFMFAVALTLQSGAGMSAFSSGNAFIALGAAYFLVSISSTRIVEHLGKRATLLLGCAIQMSGLLLLMAPFYYGWATIGVLILMPATLVIGGGQALIVSTFYRIGMADVPRDYAGAGSATLSTVQQAAFGMGPMVLGSVFTQMLLQGDYRHAVLATLAAEWLLMLALVAHTLWSRRIFAVPCRQTTAPLE